MEKSVSDIADEYLGEIVKFEADLRKRIIQALKSHGGEFVFPVNTEDDDDLELPYTITYYGGNHPEYASNAYSTLESVKLHKDESEFIAVLEDGEQMGIECDIYGLVNICNFIDIILAEEN